MKYVHYEADVILSKLITRKYLKYVRQQTLPSVREPDYASNFYVFGILYFNTSY